MATVMAGVAGMTATLMLAAGPASATASVNRYEGLRPELTGCADDAVTIQRKSIIGSADIWLRYSPSCRTIWAHIGGAPPRTQDNAGGSALIYREQDGAADRCNSGTNSTNDFSTPSYTVQRGEQIRIDSLESLVDWADGHGTGHSSRPFIYRHSNGAHRLTNCRWT